MVLPCGGSRLNIALCTCGLADIVCRLCPVFSSCFKLLHVSCVARISASNLYPPCVGIGVLYSFLCQACFGSCRFANSRFVCSQVEILFSLLTSFLGLGFRLFVSLTQFATGLLVG